MTKRFITTAMPIEINFDQFMCPLPIRVNDRAATRTAIIESFRRGGGTFYERSEWGAYKNKGDLENDWDYSMIALHHAGRSYSCGAGAEQMLETQGDHLKKYSDIGYHYGVSCDGHVYEGRDIRFKGSSVVRYNTGVIGIVLLNNYSTAEEGGDLVAWGREAAEKIGISTINSIPPLQIDAVVQLVEALRSVFLIQCFGGHREFPNQVADGKICPGNVGMELVRNIRIRTQLQAPPAS
ncbi:peptidoglycan recognition protein family protein [Pseudomonas panipatensis]|uniref:peptidoglycan recognition protein family protein n=1 Tax=Pseudomonas panipatensis TaxID=428992 RepID=UPI0035B1C527